jgi:hypothetical protein
MSAHARAKPHARCIGAARAALACARFSTPHPRQPAPVQPPRAARRRSRSLQTRAASALAASALALVGLLPSSPAMALEEPAFERVLVDGANELRRYAPMIVAETWVEGALSEGSNAGFRAIAGYIFGANRARGADSAERIAMTVPVTMEPRSERIAMTVPVTTDAPTRTVAGQGERIAMTAPVTTEAPGAKPPAASASSAARADSANATGRTDAARGTVASTGPTPSPGTTVSPPAASGERIAMTAPVATEAGGNRWRMHFVMPSKYTLATLPVPTDPRVTLREVPARQVAARTFSGFVTEARVSSETEALRAWMMERGLQADGPAQLARYNPPWSIPFLRRNEILIPVR